MTPNDFRRIALSLPEAVEAAHRGHPDFRVGGKVFAALGYSDARWAMVKLKAGAASEVRCRKAGSVPQS